MKRAGASVVLWSATTEKGCTEVKYIDKMLIASGVTLLLTGGVAAAALAPTAADTVIAQLPGGVAIFASNGPFGSGNVLTTAATYIGITEAQLRTELQTGKSLADIAVAHGKTRDGLIAALTADAAKQIATAVDQPGTSLPFGRGGPGGPGGFRVNVNEEAAAAAYIGTTEADLRAKEQAGQTLAQIAVAAGKTRDGLIAALVADGNTKIDAALAAGKITAAQAATAKSSLTARVTAEVDETGPAGGPGGRGPRR
jgi:DNA-binding phage protein